MSGIKSRLYAVILAVIVLGYGFFFASRFILREVRVFLYTEIGTTEKLSDEVTLTLKKWVYSPSEEKMMVMFSVTNNSLKPIDLNWSTTERHTKKLMSMETGTVQNRLSTELTYPFSNMVIVKIKDVPAGFEEIALVLQLAQSDEGKAENKRVVFYTNVRNIEQTDIIGDYSDNDYRILYLQIEKSDKTEKIRELTETNSKLLSDNESYRKNIDELIADQQFETADEIQETNGRIESYRRQITKNNEQIEANKYEISELKQAVVDIEGAIGKINKTGVLIYGE